MSPQARWREQLARLPRDTRDTLFMLVLIGWTIAPHLLRLSPGFSLLCLAVLVWRGRLAWRQAPLPGRWSLIAVLAVAAGLTWWTERTLIGKDAGVTLLVSLMALKTLELRARRDALVVFFLGFFLVLTNFLYSQSLGTALAMAISVWGWLTALTLAHMPAGRPRLRDAAGLAGRAAAVGTPVMIALFLLFPRIGPLWSMPGGGATTGLSDELRLGSVAELAQDDSIALRLKVDGPQPPPQTLYFRGPVLSNYDGLQWTAPLLGSSRAQVPPGDIQPTGPALPYEITLEPLHLPWLPLLETTPEPPVSQPPLDGLLSDRLGQWRLRQPPPGRVRLQAVAYPQSQRGLQLSQRAQRTLVELPAGHHPRTLQWAANLRAQPALREADAGTLARAVLQHIRSAPFRYTLSPGVYEGDSIDEFWLDRRAGFCEHYAAAFVVVMRALDVPARIVTGYQGSDPVPVDGYLIVRQSNAHAWAEYWQAGQGWVRADPTAAVAPERIDRGRALRPPPGVVLGALDAVSPGLRLQLRQWMEALDNRWNQSVLGYGRNQQSQLLDKLGLPSTDLNSLGQVLAGLLALVATVGAGWAAWDARRRSPWQRLQALLTRELQRLDVAAPPQSGPGQLAAAVLQRHGEAGRALADSLLRLQALRYGPPPAVGSPPQPRDGGPGWRREFRQHCKALRRQQGAPT